MNSNQPSRKELLKSFQKSLASRSKPMQIEARRPYMRAMTLSCYLLPVVVNTAFLLPLIERLDPKAEGIQAIVLVPSRELAVQIEQVSRQLGSAEINAVYGEGLSNGQGWIQTKPALLIEPPDALPIVSVAMIWI